MRHSGFTLIEILIYSALVALMLTFTITTTYSLVDNAARTQEYSALIENKEFITSKLQWVLSGVTSINSPAPGTESATLSVNKINNPQNPFVVDLQNGVIRLSRGGEAAINLTNSHATVSNLIFTHIINGATSSLRLTATLSNAVGSVPLQTAITIR